ncbi:alpha/beta hydrolase family protein [Porphyrobacter sp. LM 6]|uniref:alpha/beta hydrolase family protein n=1 Tax=Porphyrobacter sp. LM 6 TaxID=1896196 RepID=UPI0008472C0A|nr:S9 family peptidase [Porphyrobacter sp. LM 6]AOL93366.1 Dipeptidyl aminopeptidase/acylaminoacyl peptidase [Porphyrobacter sp. LM 6]
MSILAASGAFAAALLSAPLAAETAQTVPGVTAPPMSAHDLVTMPRLGAPAVNRAGTLAVYGVTTTNPESLTRSTTYYVHDLGKPEAAPVALDFGIKASDPVFGADGQLYFLSSAHPDKAAPSRSRVWRVAISAEGVSGTPQPVADFDGADIAGFKLSPDGKRIAVWAEVPRDCPRIACPDTKPAYLPGPGTGRLYDGADGFYRHWDRWATPGLHNRIFVFPLAGGVAQGEGAPVDGRDPATGITADTPTMPFGGVEEIAFSPDGKTLYFTARLADGAEPGSTNLDIYASDLSGAAPILLTANNAATDTAPTPSPDGRYIAWLAMARPTYEADKLAVHLLDLKTGKARNLTEATDLSFATLAWSADGKSLIATAEKVLDTPAFRIDPQTGAVTELNLMAGNEAHIANVVPLAGGRALFTRDSLGNPAELFLSDGMGQARPLTDVATTRMGGLANIVTRRFSFAGANGDTVWGQITRLADQTGPIPAILYIHGGPQGSFNDSWSSRWNPRVVASQGYAVISVDFHGSTGYGQAFTDAIRTDWGGKPFEDLQKGLAAALALDSQIDGSRACAMGASYGGYMVNWIAGNWPDRFKCIVQHDGIFDMRSMYYSTEELWFPRWDFEGSYEQARETYEKWNPANHVGKWKTPMLVVTGQQDFRVPYSQGLMSFTALQERGIPSQLLVFPDENHWVLKPKNSLQWHNTVFAWLNRWLKPEQGK